MKDTVEKYSGEIQLRNSIGIYTIQKYSGGKQWGNTVKKYNWEMYFKVYCFDSVESAIFKFKRG